MARAARKDAGLAVQVRHQSRTVLTRVHGSCHSEPLPLLQPDRISKFAPMPTQFRVFIAPLAHQIPQPVGEGVELLLHSLIGARLSVLQQRDEQKRNDRRHR